MGASTVGFTYASLMGLGPQYAVETARRAAELGYRSFWTAETTGPEAFSLLAAAGAAAPGVDLGTGVLALQLRTPPLAAMSAATLSALDPDRDVLLGVGISSPVVTSRWHGAPYGDRPLGQVREYVALVQECLSGEKVTFAGDHYQVKGFRLGVRFGDGARRPQVVLGALGPRMLALAGEVADGVLLNYLPASHVAWSVEQVRKGEAAAGREPGSCTVYAYVHAGVADRDGALANGRKDLFSYAVVDSYAESFTKAGFGDSVTEVRERHAAGDREGALAAVSEEMVDAIDVVGHADLVRDTFRAYVAAGVDHPVLMPLPWGPDRRQVVDDTMRAAISA
ncbi:MAG TPA: LLM class F420-dependent oxidoreductase [Iamia sp.]